MVDKLAWARRDERREDETIRRGILPLRGSKRGDVLMDGFFFG